MGQHGIALRPVCAVVDSRAGIRSKGELGTATELGIYGWHGNTLLLALTSAALVLHIDV